MRRVGDEREQAMQRVRVGMIGLAAVILLIGLASILFSGIRREPASRAGAGTNAAVIANIVANESDGSDEPLADLGLAPGSDADNAAAPAR